MEYRESAGELAPDRSVLVVGVSGNVFGIDRATGTKRWHRQLPGNGAELVFVTAGFGVVVASAVAAVVYCIDYLTGELLWEKPTQHKGRATILIEPDQIVCAKGGGIDCFAPDGRRLWRQPLEETGYGRIALAYPGNSAQADG
jgi:hypothetical protein